jgi:hypothetical protein
VSESAVSAKRGWGSFGAKPAQSETPVRAAAKRRPTRKRAQWKEDAQPPLTSSEVGYTSRHEVSDGVDLP